MKSKEINVAVGFVTGRKNFKNVAKAYVCNWNEVETLDEKKYKLHLFVVYDLDYTSTKESDYIITEEEILNEMTQVYYYGCGEIEKEVQTLIAGDVVSVAEARLIFGEGYAMKRNAVLYFALKKKMDFLIFLDDDEYPIANIKMDDEIVWKGQAILSTHIQNLMYCDMTHGHHCGYISPIPHINYSDKLSEDKFRCFIEAISNDIISWQSIQEKMDDGGVTYADTSIINSQEIELVKEINGMKFISGANLGINLKNPNKLFPFYNPPGARGEDTFLSTCIGEYEIRKVPCYTFHDGFGAYEHLLLGALPNNLKHMNADSHTISLRFLKAAIGWVRYKPLLLYITQKDEYGKEINKMKKNLKVVIPSICEYFGNEEFNTILTELDFYDANVKLHYDEFLKTKDVWANIIRIVCQ